MASTTVLVSVLFDDVALEEVCPGPNPAGFSRGTLVISGGGGVVVEGDERMPLGVTMSNGPIVFPT